MGINFKLIKCFRRIYVYNLYNTKTEYIHTSVVCCIFTTVVDVRNCSETITSVALLIKTPINIIDNNYLDFL